MVRKGEKVIDVASLGPKVGKRMTVAGGRHEGLECEVKALSVNGDSGAPLLPVIHTHPNTLLQNRCSLFPSLHLYETSVTRNHATCAMLQPWIVHAGSQHLPGSIS